MARLARRHLLGLLAATPALARPGAVQAAPDDLAPQPPGRLADAPRDGALTPGGQNLLVAGPASSSIARWAGLIASPLAQALVPGAENAALRQAWSGGIDGVTAANQLDARVTPDGLTALLVSGSAGLAWLVGDPRVHFDTAHWVPAFAALSSCVLVGRIAAPAWQGLRRVRVAVGAAVGRDAPALLGVELLGARIEPVFGIEGKAATLAALRAGRVDVALISGQGESGQDMAAQIAGLPDGTAPLCTLGVLDETGQPVRDRLLPTLPHLAELAAQLHANPPHGALYAGWRAASCARQLAAGLVLPALTPAAMVAQWRAAGGQVAASAQVQDIADAWGAQAVGPAIATANIGAIAARPDAVLDLRRWLADRLNWQPG